MSLFEGDLINTEVTCGQWCFTAGEFTSECPLHNVIDRIPAQSQLFPDGICGADLQP
ncbi:Uncharacterised protein [Klebsiella pneumoniae]|uniref:Uncharacterized protein n=1 Tax=Klebsiella pneumoniae TaxID=573 RepID=A0A378H7Y8_KLEPN|nr:Uncharacterised protein [Klebsiella pneumoniae]